jgi:hypothetical protein
MWIAVFGGLSPLRGPLATASAEGENSKLALDGAMAPAHVRHSPRVKTNAYREPFHFCPKRPFDEAPLLILNLRSLWLY